MRRYLALSLFVVMVIPGCATHTLRPEPVHAVQPEPVPKVVIMPFSRIENSVQVAVDPYIQPERQMEIFNDDLKKLGVIPIYVLVENRGDRELSPDRAAIVLELPDGRQIDRVQAATAAAGRLRPGMPGAGDTVLLQGPRVPRGGYGYTPTPIAALHLGYELIRSLTGLLLLPVKLAVYNAGKGAHEELKADYMNKEFQDVVLSKDASAHGFVYFLPPSGTLWYTKARLALRFLDKTDNTSFVIRVPVSESGLFKDKKGGETQY